MDNIEFITTPSIDIDGNDYWVWKAIDGYSPRVVAIEYNASIPSDKSLAVEYCANDGWDGSNYFGASLLAMTKLGLSKGYVLVACDSVGANAFFVRQDLAEKFPKKTIEEIYNPPGYGLKIDGHYQGHPASGRKMIEV
jgi:hypothetical protein